MSAGNSDLTGTTVNEFCDFSKRTLESETTA